MGNELVTDYTLNALPNLKIFKGIRFLNIKTRSLKREKVRLCWDTYSGAIYQVKKCKLLHRFRKSYHDVQESEVVSNKLKRMHGYEAVSNESKKILPHDKQLVITNGIITRYFLEKNERIFGLGIYHKVFQNIEQLDCFLQDSVFKRFIEVKNISVTYKSKLIVADYYEIREPILRVIEDKKLFHNLFSALKCLFAATSVEAVKSNEKYLSNWCKTLLNNTSPDMCWDVESVKVKHYDVG